MHENKTVINGIEFDVISLNTVVVGSGAAGLNAADSLNYFGQKDVAIITEGMCMGTSRNTGSDKQTYYKLSLAGSEPDSVEEMANTLFQGGAMHGDIALVEAALSAQCFYKLVGIGVPFPHNSFGEYVGYKTDHDSKKRATSAGPLTSRYMTERLEEQVRNKGIRIVDRFVVIGILTDEDNTGEKKSIGLIALNMDKMHLPSMGFTLFNCTNIVYATGGAAGIYLHSVYPESQTGMLGVAFEAGVRGVNLTESQYGISSVKFRWNLSGTYQQVLPRYVSINEDGSDEKEFLQDFFENPGQMLNAIFLKGYQWPFDPRKIGNLGSSCIDLLVYYETQILRRRVFLDFTRNPVWGSKNLEIDFSLLNEEAYLYLKNSEVLFGKPIDRLKKINSPAIEIFKSNGIDLSCEWLEIAVCAQHCNGGLSGDKWGQSNVKNFFSVGEANGTFGVYRPGGSALNSTQAGSFRAAQYIAANYGSKPVNVDSFVNACKKTVEDKFMMANKFLQHKSDMCSMQDIRRLLQTRMSAYGAHIRSENHIDQCIEACLSDIERLHDKMGVESVYELPDAFRCRDMLLTQYLFLISIKEYIKNGGGSRGSYVICDSLKNLVPENIKNNLGFRPEKESLRNFVCEVELEDCKSYNCFCEWKPVRSIPLRNNWFEKVWNEYLKGEII